MDNKASSFDHQIKFWLYSARRLIGSRLIESDIDGPIIL